MTGEVQGELCSREGLGEAPLNTNRISADLFTTITTSMPPPLSPMQAVENALKNLLQSLPPTSSDKEVLEDLVRSTLANVQGHASPENRKTQWEYALKNEIFSLAVRQLQSSYRFVDSVSCLVGFGRPGFERRVHALL